MIGFVVPMEKEAWKLIERLEKSRKESLGGRTLYSGLLGRIEVKILISGCGKILSASATQFLLDRFDCSAVIHFGSGGAILPELHIGDIVIGDEIIEYDYYRHFGEPEPVPISRSHSGLASKFQKWTQRQNVRSVRGIILSGNEDVVTTARRDQLSALHRGGLSVDWESGACASVCNLMGMPVLVLRGMVDYAYEGTHHEFSGNLGDVSERLGDLIADFVSQSFGQEITTANESHFIQAEKILQESLRKKSFAQKWEQAHALREVAWNLKFARIRSQNPEWSEDRVKDSVREVFLYGST